MKTIAKKSRRYIAIRREIEQGEARLRKYLGRLVESSTKPGGSTYDYKPRMTFRAFCIIMRIDHALVGTPDYMGLAYWWDHEYKHSLRACTTKQRKKAHDALLAAGLALDGVSDEHERIIAWATNNGRQASKEMGGNWKPYRGSRPAKRKVTK